MKSKKTLLFTAIFLAFATSCVLTRSLRFADCEFDYDELVYLKANNINVLGKDELSDLSTSEGFSLSKALASKKLTIDLLMNVAIKNPNDKVAVLNTVDWILQIKKKDVLEGSTNKRIEVAPNGGTATLPLQTSFDLYKLFTDYSFSEIGSLLWDLSSNPTNPDVITYKLKPSFQIAGQQVKYPGYININY